MTGLLLGLLACGPAELKTTQSTDTQAPINLIPEQFGVNAAPDCDQKNIGSNVCNIFLYDQFGSFMSTVEK